MSFGKPSRTSTKNCYDIDDYERSYSESNGSFIGSDDDSEYIPKIRLRTINEGVKIERRPTRIPNLKIQNRNALLARENRKRKKEMMVNLEKSVDDLQIQNKTLHKVMKLKDFQIEKLTREVKYLKSVITNRTEIVSILKSLPQIRNTNKRKETIENENASTVSDDTISCNDDGNEFEDPFLPFSASTDDFPLTDLDVISTDWDEILRDPFSIGPDFLDVSPSKRTEGPSVYQNDAPSDHNYSHEKENAEDELPGICLHINTGRVSLEFCATCHFNSSSGN